MLLNVIMMAIVVLIVMIVLITWITQSRFFDHYSIPGAFFIFGIGLACFRGAQLMKQQTDWRFMVGLLAAFVVGGYMINLHNTNHAWSGALILTLAFVADAGYSAYMKWGSKKPMDEIPFWGGIVCDVVLIGLLIYGMTGDI